MNKKPLWRYIKDIAFFVLPLVFLFIFPLAMFLILEPKVVPLGEGYASMQSNIDIQLKLYRLVEVGDPLHHPYDITLMGDKAHYYAWSDILSRYGRLFASFFPSFDFGLDEALLPINQSINDALLTDILPLSISLFVAMGLYLLYALFDKKMNPYMRISFPLGGILLGLLDLMIFKDKYGTLILLVFGVLSLLSFFFHKDKGILDKIAYLPLGISLGFLLLIPLDILNHNGIGELLIHSFNQGNIRLGLGCLISLALAISLPISMMGLFNLTKDIVIHIQEKHQETR